MNQSVYTLRMVKRLVLDHKVAVFLALLTALVVVLPQIYFRIDHSRDGVYQGIELLPDSPWSPRVREVQDGYPSLGSIYYKDGKDNPYLFQPLGTMVWGYIGKIFFLDINNTFLFSRFILTCIVSLLIYVFVILISKNKLAALCSMVVILLADSILSYSGMFKIIHAIRPEDFLSIGKPVNTMISIPFFGFLIAFWFFYRNGYWRYGLLSALLLGLNFYNYFYTWTFLFAFLGILGFICLVQKKWQEVINIAGVCVGGVLVAIPYLINLYRATEHPVYEVASMRFGIVLSHAPLFIGFVAVVALIIFVYGFEREDRKTYFFGLALLLTPLVTLNQQIVTGKLMQAGHYHWYFHKPLAVIFTLIIVFSILSKSKLKTYQELCALIIITISIATGVFIQIDSYYNSTIDGGAALIERQRYGSSMRWLDENAKKDAVVFANDEISHITVIYTSLNVMYHRSAYATLSATEERLLDALFLFYRLRGISHDSVRDTFYKDREYLSVNLYGVYYAHLAHSVAAIPDEKIEEIILRYQETLTVGTVTWIQNIFKKYEVEYVVWDKKVNPEWQIEKLPFLTEVAVFDDVVIYQFSHDTMVGRGE